MIRNLFAPLAMKIAGGLCLALALLAGLQTLRLSWAREALATERAERAEIARKAVAEARERDARGIEAATRDKALSEAEIDRGRDAAIGAADPWAAAVGAMK